MKIGDLRRKYFADFDCVWNGLVRDISASLETSEEDVDEAKFLRLLISNAASSMENHYRSIL